MQKPILNVFGSPVIFNKGVVINILVILTNISRKTVKFKITIGTYLNIFEKLTIVLLKKPIRLFSMKFPNIIKDKNTANSLGTKVKVCS
jgi:hypothetical protein